ncbi:hypothetical protein CERSUDRAFT_67324 [Gelatoporia subvermispora B]|uniref:Uncharacterized protein n=1 Tax=Ceriporiopsis subvermispora (strain B) TaxID=914234 RepID=M2R7A4_CERS8|nr:hypothetical protein CERSUDRAFT_67324 [Gelatoporia subvermispora B]
MFEVKFEGAVHVMQAAVKFFRKVNEPGVGGRLLQASSLAALEGISEALTKDIDPSWNIKESAGMKLTQITLIEPGAFRTKRQSKVVGIDTIPAYVQAPVSVVRARMLSLGEDPHCRDPLKASHAFYAIEGAIMKSLDDLLADTNACESWSQGVRHGNILRNSDYV